jgi:hypothetical protein
VTSIKTPSPASASVHPILQLQQTIGNQAVQRLLRSRTIQAKLAISQPGDIYEQEADRVAEHVMRMSEPAVQRACAPCSAGGAPCPKCSAEKKEELVQRKTEQSSNNKTEGIPDNFLQNLGPGQPLDKATRSFFEPRFRRDFSQVRLNNDEAANQTVTRLHARAFTYGRDIWLGKGESKSDKPLMAHELTHVVQQSEGAPRTSPHLIQRQETKTFVGKDNVCVAYEDRALNVNAGTPLSETKTPGGRVIPGTKGSHQNCAGASLCGRMEYINWPFLGLEAADGVRRPPDITADWLVANEFVPAGCKPVDCFGISISATRCRPSEREVILFLYQWPAGVLKGTSTVVYRSDFHMIGRTPSSLPMAWESKMDKRERVEDIRDPWQSLYDAYPHTKGKDRVIRQHCFCCDCGGITTR